MTRKVTAALVTLGIWALVAAVVIVIAARPDFYNEDLKLGYLFEAVLVFVAFLGTEAILTRLGLDPPYQPE